MRRLFATCAFLLLSAGSELPAQPSKDVDTRTSTRLQAYDPLLTWATVWGDTERQGVYTCEEWKRYATKLFDAADRNHDGFLDAQEFESIRKADKMLKDADLAYFDDNRDGRVSRSEFVNKPNPFFARYDTHGKCRVTLDDVTNALAAEQRASAARRR